MHQIICTNIFDKGNRKDLRLFISIEIIWIKFDIPSSNFCSESWGEKKILLAVWMKICKFMLFLCCMPQNNKVINLEICVCFFKRDKSFKICAEAVNYAARLNVNLISSQIFANFQTFHQTYSSLIVLNPINYCFNGRNWLNVCELFFIFHLNKANH